MKRVEWRFSAKQAANDPFIRWTLIGTLFVFIGTTVYFAWGSMPSIRETGLVVLHYNTYLGIDAVRPWPWIFLLPGIPLGLVIFDTIASFLLFQSDRLASRALMGLLGVSISLWSVGMYFLMRMNS